MTTLSIVALDDDEFQLLKLEQALNLLDASYTLQKYTSFPEYQTHLYGLKKMPDLFVIDIHLDESDHAVGIRAIGLTKEKFSNVLIVACSNDLSAVKGALQAGATDFVFKKSPQEEIALRLKTAMASRQIPMSSPNTRPVVGATMRMVASRLQDIVKSAVRSVYVEGESGTGKEIVAALTESLCPPGTPFIKVNCAAISPQLLESELFGHVKGAFTGALQDRKGHLESASGGWIFLDEVATLTLHAQAALLRALENGEVTKIGSSTPVKVNVKMIAATNEPLSQLVKQKKFRNDLYQRLREAVVELPPLRNRKEEIEEFVEHFCLTADGGPYSVSLEALSILKDCDWQDGNIRSLRNCLRAMTEKPVNRVLTPLSIPRWALVSSTYAAPEGGEQVDGSLTVNFDPQNFPSFQVLSDNLLAEVLRYFGNFPGKYSLREVGRVLNIPKSTLSVKIKQLSDGGLIKKNDLERVFGD